MNRFSILAKIKSKKLTVKKYLKNNGQKYLKNNGQKIFEK